MLTLNDDQGRQETLIILWKFLMAYKTPPRGLREVDLASSMCKRSPVSGSKIVP